MILEPLDTCAVYGDDLISHSTGKAEAIRQGLSQCATTLTCVLIHILSTFLLIYSRDYSFSFVFSLSLSLLLAVHAFSFFLLYLMLILFTWVLHITFYPHPNIPFPETFLNILSSLYFLISTCPSLSNHFHYYFKELKFLLSFKSKSKSSVSLHILLASST